MRIGEILQFKCPVHYAPFAHCDGPISASIIDSIICFNIDIPSRGSREDGKFDRLSPEIVRCYRSW